MTQTPLSGQNVPQGPQGNYGYLEPNKYMAPSPYSPYHMAHGGRNMNKCELACCVPADGVKSGKVDKSKKSQPSIMPTT